MQQAKQALKPIIDGIKPVRPTQRDTAGREDEQSGDRQLQTLTSSANSAVENLISAFRDAKTVEARCKGAAIRMFPVALEAMNKQGNDQWKLEQSRFADLQRAQQPNQGRGY